MSMHKTSATATVAVVAALMLAGCAAEPSPVPETPVSEPAPEVTTEPAPEATPEPEPEDASAEWDFTSLEPLTEATSIRFEVPEQLVNAAGNYVEYRVFKSITVNSIELNDDYTCGIDMQFEYPAGFDMEKTLDAAAGLGGASTLLSFGSDKDSDAADPRLLTAASVMGLDTENVRGFGKPDLGNPEEKGMWIAKDYSSATVLTDCAPEASELYEKQRVAFMYIDGTDVEAIAEAQVVAVEADGLAVVGSTVEQYVPLFGGAWEPR